jgi:hypothetical protein
MFNLELAIKTWRQQLRAAGIRSAATLDELESHLRDAIEHSLCSGAEEEIAFQAALQRLGDVPSLRGEFQKVNGVWRRALGVFMALVAVVLLAALAALHVFSQGMLQSVFLMDGLLLSLVLPLMASAFARCSHSAEKPWMRAVWWGQGLQATGGLMIILVLSHPLVGLLLAIVSCAGCARWAWRQWRGVMARERVA